MAPDPSYLFLPADRTLRALADEIEQELRHRLTSVDDPASQPEVSESSNEIAGAFVPLDARVEAQGALMGGLQFSNPAQATAIYTLARDLGEDPDEIYRRVVGDQAPVLPVLRGETEFERRERLRKVRKRLVGHLHHRTGRDYAEINTWINDAVACGKSVGEHTINELEKSVRLLTQEIANYQGPVEEREAVA